MQHKRSLLFIFSALLSLFLVACGNAEGDDAEESGDTQNSSLSQSLRYDAETGSAVTLSYPDGWASSTESGSIQLASSEDILTDNPASPATGQVVVSVLTFTSEEASNFVGAESATVTSLANAVVTNFGEAPEAFNPVEEITINGNNAAVLTGDIESDTDGVALVAVVVTLDEENFAIVIGGTAQGEGDSIRPTIEAIAGSIEYTVASGE